MSSLPPPAPRGGGSLLGPYPRSISRVDLLASGPIWADLGSSGIGVPLRPAESGEGPRAAWEVLSGPLGREVGGPQEEAGGAVTCPRGERPGPGTPSVLRGRGSQGPPSRRCFAGSVCQAPGGSPGRTPGLCGAECGEPAGPGFAPALAAAVLSWGLSSHRAPAEMPRWAASRGRGHRGLRSLREFQGFSGDQ